VIQVLSNLQQKLAQLRLDGILEAVETEYEGKQVLMIRKKNQLKPRKRGILLNLGDHTAELVKLVDREFLLNLQEQGLMDGFFWIYLTLDGVEGSEDLLIKVDIRIGRDPILYWDPKQGRFLEN
jgi:hypothetical protein